MPFSKFHENFFKRVLNQEWLRFMDVHHILLLQLNMKDMKAQTVSVNMTYDCFATTTTLTGFMFP